MNDVKERFKNKIPPQLAQLKWVPVFTPSESENCRFARGIRAETTLSRNAEIFLLG